MFAGRELGTHLGGWTPFEFEVTDILQTKSGQNCLLEVRVDERVGHNTQGFLPVIAPHFGGIWQPVRIVFRNEVYVVEQDIKAIGNFADNQIELELPVVSVEPLNGSTLGIRYRLQNQAWSEPLQIELDHNSIAPASGSRWLVTATVPVHSPVVWSPENPSLYELEIVLSGTTKDGQPFQTKTRTRTAFRDIRVAGNQILLNGEPIIVRGLLNWGYAPPSNAPSLDERFMRNEIEVAKSLGFNLMKFCLWIPPKRYLELCDEMGILAWIEYPTWHPDFSEEHLEDLRREYTEFFHFDRNHPSVILRSLTCETGPSADLNVVRELYDLCKKEIPGAIVEDDSSWIQWNRIHDFYDDHPYGNNHTWPATLERLNQFIREREQKPLVLGEAIAGDTWVDPADVASFTTDAFYRPWFVDANEAWLAKMSALGADLAVFQQRSKRYAHRMRKYQIEKFREMVPSGGYVISVIRDFPKASMGLIDYSGNPKWKAREWAFQADDCLLLKTENDRRSVYFDEDLQLPVFVKRGVLPAVNVSELRIATRCFLLRYFSPGQSASLRPTQAIR